MDFKPEASRFRFHLFPLSLICRYIIPWSINLMHPSDLFRDEHDSCVWETSLLNIIKLFGLKEIEEVSPPKVPFENNIERIHFFSSPRNSFDNHRNQIDGCVFEGINYNHAIRLGRLTKPYGLKVRLDVINFLEVDNEGGLKSKIKELEILGVAYSSYTMIYNHVNANSYIDTIFSSYPNAFEGILR